MNPQGDDRWLTGYFYLRIKFGRSLLSGYKVYSYFYLHVLRRMAKNRTKCDIVIQTNVYV